MLASSSLGRVLRKGAVVNSGVGLGRGFASWWKRGRVSCKEQKEEDEMPDMTIPFRSKKRLRGESLVRKDVPYPPKLEQSTLSNGTRVLSADLGGYVSTLGFFIPFGSRDETEGLHGISRILAHSGFHCSHLPHAQWYQVVRDLQKVAVQSGSVAGREYLSFQGEVPRTHATALAPHLLSAGAPMPLWLSSRKQWEDDLKEAALRDENELMTLGDEARVSELLHSVGWGGKTLGNRLLDSTLYSKMNPVDRVVSYLNEYRNKIQPPAFVALNVDDHNELCETLENTLTSIDCFWSTSSTTTPTDNSVTSGRTPSAYVGGEIEVVSPTKLESWMQPLVHQAIAYEAKGGWRSPDLIALSVLQSMLGGGTSFSSGGPGKGMHTRLYTEVLSYAGIETCAAYFTPYSDSGLFGLYIASEPEKAGEARRLIEAQLERLGVFRGGGELQRAKNMLKMSVLTSGSNAALVVEDLGRQLLTDNNNNNSNNVTWYEDVCEQIENIQETDVGR